MESDPNLPQDPPPPKPPRPARPARAVAQAPVTPEALLAAMDELDQEKKGWLHTVVVLGCSLFAFTALGLLQRPVLDVALLILVLFVHESGHYIGMRIFNYRNVKMFFIPFLGAAVSGRKTQVEGWKQAVVCLLGPLPGIHIGIALYCVNLAHPDPNLRHLATLFLILNLFQLIPIYPLDGGRFVNEVLFVRSRHLETGFRVVAGLVGMGAGVLLGSWLLGVIGFFVLTSAPNAWRIGTKVQEMRELGIGPLDESETRMPLEVAYVVLPELTCTFPSADLKTLAMHARDLWERLCAKAPDWLASTVLIFACLGTFVAGLVALVVFTFAQGYGFDKSIAEGVRAYKARNFTAAEEHFREAQRAAEGFKEDDLRRAKSLQMLGLALDGMNKPAEAEACLRSELEFRERVQGKHHADLARVLSDLANVVGRDPARKAEAEALRARREEALRGGP
ncbi:MAG: hypothetical protein KIS92_09005 [Planctomycetota bacterium]|nr:hypothetical protein [Planctomycetota bacterium]